ncbi:MAG: rhodanese-like domain-containing protein [Pseudomonadota bacterium]
MKYILAAIITLFVSFCANAEKVYKDISQQELLKAGKGEFLIVDVRRPGEFEEGHVPNAINIPLADIQASGDLLPPGDIPIVMYCRSGKRANKALIIMHERGHSNLFHLEGDMLGWFDAELPVAYPEK